MARLKRIGVILMVVGMSLLVGVVVRDTMFLGRPQSSTTMIPPNSYYSATFPSHYRSEELTITVNTQNGTVQCLILLNAFNLTDVIEHFSSQQTFLVNSNESLEFTANYGTLTVVFFNPTDLYLSVSYTIKSKSLDYGVLTIVGILTTTGIAVIASSHVLVRKTRNCTTETR